MFDEIQEYMQDVEMTTVLTKEEETRLGNVLVAARMAAADGKIIREEKSGYFSAPKNADAETKKMVSRANEARETLITSNLRLAVKCAYEYANKCKCKLDTIDLIQAANEALIYAVDYFDPNNGRFSTIAVRKINWAIGRAVDETSRTIRFPSHCSAQERNIYRISIEFEEQYGRRPSVQELRDITGLTLPVIEGILTCSSVSSLNAGLPDGSNSGETTLTLEDTISSHDSFEDDICDAIDSDSLKAAFKEAFARAGLTERENAVIRMRYGIDGKSKTLEEVGRELGITRERVRQVGNTAIEKLKRSPTIWKLGDYLYPGASREELAKKMGIGKWAVIAAA